MRFCDTWRRIPQKREGAAPRTEQNRYLFCSGTTTGNWAQARDFCRAVGYELISVADVNEQRFFRSTAASLSAGEWWIGGNDGRTEGTFLWVADGSAVSYTNWESGAPNNFNNQDCIEVDTAENGAITGEPGGWNDESCNDTHPFVCEAGS